MVPFLWRRGAKREPGRANIKNGVVRSTSDNRWLEPTTPSAPAKEASRHFLNGRSHPSLSKVCPRRGLRLSLQLFSMPPCPPRTCKESPMAYFIEFIDVH